MQRRQLMNLVTVAATAVPVAVLVGGYAFYFFPQISGGAGGAVAAGDKDGNPVALDAWVKSHKPNDRELVQGLKGDATYLVSTADGVKDFGINAVCTHLGCVVPWNVQANRFICPCHGLELSRRKRCDPDSWPDTELGSQSKLQACWGRAVSGSSSCLCMCNLWSMRLPVRRERQGRPRPGAAVPGALPRRHQRWQGRRLPLDRGGLPHRPQAVVVVKCSHG